MNDVLCGLVEGAAIVAALLACPYLYGVALPHFFDWLHKRMDGEEEA